MFGGGDEKVATPAEIAAEAAQRKAIMQTSNWTAAQEGPPTEYIPVSSTPLDSSYQKCKSMTRAEYLERTGAQLHASMKSSQNHFAPAADFVGSKYYKPAKMEEGTTIVLGSDPRETARSSEIVGREMEIPPEPIDLLQRVATMRDPTLDGSHRASMTEGHFLSIWDPYDSVNPSRSRSFQSAVQLRDAYHRHQRSQFHPDEKYVLPPTVQSDMGWGLNMDAYKASCAKFQEGAIFHGRKASAITKFGQQLALGPRSHLSGPMTKPALHY